MADAKTEAQDFVSWTKAALPWAVLHFGVVGVTAYGTSGNAVAVGVATWPVVILAGAVHYNRGTRDARRAAEDKQSD